MRLSRRGAALALLALAAPGQGRAAAETELGFDPTQLPSFTGTVERYLPNPRGETDALLFREGPQIVFPPDIAPAVRAVAPAGQSIVVWGIRARSAPVITMLAYAPNGDAKPVVVDRFYWRLTGRQPAEGAGPLSVSGTIRQPYYTPQGEVAGAILEDGSVVLVPTGRADSVRDMLKAGQALAAQGHGREGPEGRALLAEQLGTAPDALRPLPAR
ncbi:hypothetical protein JMJ55_18295 [Belnapia sp. T6]|uniref:Uncharacterized protein n=1 Tax=Belnapia mucosa TaxID=2804532 RepID=A0ABS1V6I2_9PROT|nr:hypothetical protein [Belnapia mucosa]MBL6457289.1 hypothetical protein [Belnapia mucosa]